MRRSSIVASRLAPGTCELGGDFCTVSTPRPWTPAEIDIVRAALDGIAASDLGVRIMERARANGFRTLRRFARQARLNATVGTSPTR